MLLTAKEFQDWRNGLLATIAPSTVNRLCGCVCAALELAMQHDERIKNKHAWEIGLASLPGATQARNVISADDKVRAFVAETHALDHSLGAAQRCVGANRCAAFAGSTAARCRSA